MATSARRDSRQETLAPLYFSRRTTVKRARSAVVRPKTPGIGHAPVAWNALWKWTVPRGTCSPKGKAKKTSGGTPS